MTWGVRDEVQSSGFDAEYWQWRAEEVRRKAAIMVDPASMRAMLMVAAGYERLAQHANEQTQRPKPAE